MDRNCEICENPIPSERLEVLPNTTTCVKCSREKQRIGIMVDVAGSLEIQIADADNDYIKKGLELS